MKNKNYIIINKLEVAKKLAHLYTHNMGLQNGLNLIDICEDWDGSTFTRYINEYEYLFDDAYKIYKDILEDSKI